MAGTDLPDIYAGQVAFAPMRTKGNRSDLTVAGKDSAGRPLTVQLHPQLAKTDLPKLIWMKRRIESLLQRGKAKEAIALAEKANLVCRGAAFIAWDDTEQVAIAQDEVYQPSLKVPGGLSHESPVCFSISASAFFERDGEESWNDVEFRSDVEPVSDLVELVDHKRLTEQLARAIESILCPDDAQRLLQQLNRAIVSGFSPNHAKKLTSIVLDWAKHVDNKHVRDTLHALLRECERVGDKRKLRKILSNFFLALPDPWQTQASSIFSTLTLRARLSASKPARVRMRRARSTANTD